jgi:uncharacterized membrane protein YesL
MLSIDSLVYDMLQKFYYLLVLNFLWLIFSLPLFTIGASTTALYYVIAKIYRDEHTYIFKDFWKSFKLNFKKSTIIWCISITIYFIAYINLKNLNFMDNKTLMLIIQSMILFETFVINIYIFPLLSRYYLSLKKLVKTSFWMANRHFLNTLLCILLFFGSYALLTIHLAFITVSISFYALASYHLFKKIFSKYEINY